MTPFIISSILFFLVGNAASRPKCGRLVNNKADCLQKLSYYKKAFFTDQYENTKEKISFSDFLNCYKSAGYEFPEEAIETEPDKFYRHANGGTHIAHIFQMLFAHTSHLCECVGILFRNSQFDGYVTEEEALKANPKSGLGWLSTKYYN